MSSSLVKLDGSMLRKMIICGANKLVENKERINALNVFPVPDGDTGTNMTMTVLAAAKEVISLNTSDDVFLVSKAAASGALRGGRGNSGVIFSQFFRGFSKGLEGVDAIGTRELAVAFDKASQLAYKAVMRPQEGTILTVGRHMAEVSRSIAKETNDIELFAKKVIEEGRIILKQTPEMLPVLKQAGVVDSGGEGLVVFLEGAMEGVYATNPQIVEESKGGGTADITDFSVFDVINPEDITFGYCTEFFIHTTTFSDGDKNTFVAYMESMGDSVAIVSDDEIVKVHVHTDNPGTVMEYAMKHYGPLDAIKIDNMRLQHAALEVTSEPAGDKKPIGVLAIASGAGFKDIFTDLGADYVIEGGQTMNPSAEDIALGIKKVHADSVIVLPNNKNIILAAGQAVDLCEDGVKVSIIETKTMPQGIACMMNYLPENDTESNLEEMKAGMAEVTTGSITLAVRDTEIEDQVVKQGDYIGILEGKIVSSNQELATTAKELINAMMDAAKNCDILTIFAGVDAKEDNTTFIEEYIAENYTDCEASSVDSGQGVYEYIFSLE